MRTDKKILLLASLSVAGFLALAFMALPPGPRFISSPEAVPITDCTAPLNWFNQPTPQPMNADAKADNCNFHRWAWAEFLWLTLPADNDPYNFLTFAHPVDLFPGAGVPTAYPGRVIDEPIQVSMRRLKQDESLDVTAIAQAGSGDVLIDKQGQVVYYSQFINDVFYNFIRDNKYYDPAEYTNVPNDKDFPLDGAGTIELKTSWRVAIIDGTEYIPNASERFLTIEAMVAPVSIVEDALQEDTDNLKPATLALVGMHVVGTILKHPEFIWASFEHVDNAPVCANTPTGPPSNGDGWSFYDGTTTKPGTNCDDDGSNCNNGNTVEKTHALTPTVACQVYPEGGGTDENVRNITRLNHSVLAQLPSSVHPSRSILMNYQLVGGIWTNDGKGGGGLPAKVNGSPPDGIPLAGSLRLSNTSLETFTQTGSLDNCFACHNPGIFSPKHLDVSHIIKKYGCREYDGKDAPKACD